MAYPQRPSSRPQMSLDLGGAAGIAGGNDVGAGIDQSGGLAGAELGAGGRLDDVVDPSRAAADARLAADLDELERRDRPQQIARLRLHPCACARWQASW
jgi:hypothetical protein